MSEQQPEESGQEPEVIAQAGLASASSQVPDQGEGQPDGVE